MTLLDFLKKQAEKTEPLDVLSQSDILNAVKNWLNDTRDRKLFCRDLCPFCEGEKSLFDKLLGDLS